MSAGLPDHPRACGANLVKLKDTGDRFGSSPRVRGKRHGTDHEHETARIIPARAGQTDDFFVQLDTMADHPRACGANPVQQE